MRIFTERNAHVRGRNLYLIIVFLALLTALPLVHADPTASLHEETLSILTYNVLAHTDSFVDHFKALLLNTPLPSDRIMPMVELLTRENADIIALQEVTHPLLVALQSAPGLSNYTVVSTLPPPATGWSRYLSKAAVFFLGYQPWGQAILSKLPMTEIRTYPLYGRPLLFSKNNI